MKDYIEDKGGERRFLSPEMRADDEGVIEGIAAVVNRTTDLGWFEERIAPGAFDDVLDNDVVALFNHDPNYPLARTTAKGEGKLELYLNDKGDLGYRFKVPNTQVGKDLQENVRAGLVSKSSFAFTIKEDTWKRGEGRDGNDVRIINKVERLYDVSPVTYPAYNDTSVAARSLEKIEEKEKEKRQAIEADRIEMDRIFFDLEIEG